VISWYHFCGHLYYMDVVPADCAEIKQLAGTTFVTISAKHHTVMLRYTGFLHCYMLLKTRRQENWLVNLLRPWTCADVGDRDDEQVISHTLVHILLLCTLNYTMLAKVLVRILRLQTCAVA
jgi:hypothetical protein